MGTSDWSRQAYELPAGERFRVIVSGANDVLKFADDSLCRSIGWSA